MQQLLQHWVNRQAESRPDSTAIVWKDRRVSYRELDEASNQLARLVEAEGQKQEAHHILQRDWILD